MTIKKNALMAALSVTAFSGWAQDTSDTRSDSSANSNDDVVVTASRFAQPVSTVLAPTDIVTRDDIDRWQAKTLNDVMRRLPGVDIVQNGGMGQSSTMYIRGTSASQVLVLVMVFLLRAQGFQILLISTKSQSLWFNELSI